MDLYEQKYKEAVERAKVRRGMAAISKDDLEFIFPELKMSEDERIRKAIIESLPKYGYLPQTSIKVEDAIAWLERQKSEDVLDEEEREFADNVDSFRKEIDEAYQKGFTEGKRIEMEKITKGNLLLSFKEYDELMDSINRQKKEGYEAGYKQGLNDSKNEQKPGEIVEPKKSEDERIRKWLIDYLWKEKIFLQEAHSSVENNPKYRCVMDAIAWLEKQGEHDLTKIPKFKSGDTIEFNGLGHNRYTIKDVCGVSYYINTNNGRMDMSYTDENFEVVEQETKDILDEDEREEEE